MAPHSGGVAVSGRNHPHLQSCQPFCLMVNWQLSIRTSVSSLSVMAVSSTATASLSPIVVSHDFYGMLMQILLMLLQRRSKTNTGGRVEGLGAA